MFDIIKARRTRVWGRLVQIFHWSLVFVLIIAYISGDEEETIHIYAGYSILGLLIFRALWWVAGNRQTKVKNSVFFRKSFFDDLKTINVEKAKHYIGDRFAGVIVIRALFLGLVMATYSGIKVYELKKSSDTPVLQQLNITSSVANKGSINSTKSNTSEERKVVDSIWGEIHEGSANFVIFCALLHIANILGSGRFRSGTISILNRKNIKKKQQ